MLTKIIQNIYHIDKKQETLVLQLQTTDVDTWLARASCRFFVGAYHAPENERTDCLYDGER